MWFKNIYILKFEKALNQLEYSTYADASELHEALSKKPFTECSDSQRESTGWTPPLGKKATAFTHQAGNFILLSMAHQTRVLPASVVREELQERVEAIEDAESRRVGAKEKRELRERIEDELLPRAFTKTTTLDAYLDVNAGLLVINTPSASKAEAFATLLRKTIGSCPVTPLKTELAGINLTHWLADYEAPKGFEIGDECELTGAGDDNSTATFRKHELGTDEVKSNLAAGKTVSKLSLVWDKKISFVLGDDLVIKKLKFLDVLKEKMSEEDPETHEQRVDIELTLMAGEIAEMLSVLLEAVQVPDADQGHQGEVDDLGLDPLYEAAVDIVVETRRASISYLQRRLRVGYSRSGSLLDAMEKEGVVSAINSQGGREVITPPRPVKEQA